MDKLKNTVMKGGGAASSWFRLAKGVARTGNAQNRKASYGVLTFRNMKSLSPISALTLSFTLALATLLSGCGDDSPTTSSAPPPAVSSKLPAGWTHKENFPGGLGLTADYMDIGPYEKDFNANVFVLTSPASGISAAEAMEMEISGLRSGLGVSGVVVDSNSAVVVGGKSGQRGQFRYTQKTIDTVQQSLVRRSFLVINNGKDIQIVLTRRQDDSAAAAAFREVEASIVLN